MTQTSVQHHTIKELLAAMGAEDHGNGLHVFVKNAGLRKTPVKHPFRSDYFTIIFVTAGEACLKLNLLDYTIKKNNLLVISPNDVREFQQLSSDCEFIGVGFTRDFLSTTGIHKKNIDAFDFFSSLADPLLKPEQKDTKVLLQLFEILYAKNLEKGEHLFHEEVLQYSFAALMFEIASLFRKIHPAHLKITRKEDLAIRFLKLRPSHIQTERGLKFYADLLFVTPKYLTHTVKEITGKTAGDFIDEMVVMEAKILLNDFSKSIGQIAADLHFSDQFFFSKFFKKYAGINPSEYRSSL